jgi:two-component system chemotaxis response regulator CheB
MPYQAVAIGSSAGGINALKTILPQLPADFPAAIFIVQHISPSSESYMAKFLNNISKIEVKEADEKEEIKPGVAYVAPPNYHLLIEEDFTLSLSVEAKVNYSRPSIDVTFETAALAYGKNLIGIVLTGANSDGAYGLKTIKNSGGYTIVQNPEEAESSVMPLSAIKVVKPHKVLKLNEIAEHIMALVSR